MSLTDQADYQISGADDRSLALFEQAAHEMRCLMADPVATVDRALSESPSMTMAHVLKGWLHLLGTEPVALPVARECATAAAQLPASDRERQHVTALALLAAGRWHDASRALEDLSIEYPRDALALQVGHQIDFFTGNARMLRDRIARALPAWTPELPGYHALLGMHAFGLEETGDYEAAERQGRRAVELEPRDGWAWHAVAHTFEMRNRARLGVGWLAPHASIWSPESFLAVHNWWHLALFELELGEVSEVLRLFDEPIHGARSQVVLDMIDASALLWRLQLLGVDVGERWQTVADGWEPIAGAGNYAFNDLHAMMAFVGAGRTKAQEVVLAAQEAAMAGEGDNAVFTREVGHAASLAVQAFGEGDYGRTIRLLRPVRNTAHRFGGSHAQRDLLDLTLIEAALRAGERKLATALTEERLAIRPASPIARLFARRARQLEVPGTAEASGTADASGTSDASGAPGKLETMGTVPATVPLRSERAGAAG